MRRVVGTHEPQEGMSPGACRLPRCDGRPGHGILDWPGVSWDIAGLASLAPGGLATLAPESGATPRNL